jgi:hypothetical protein
MEGLEIISGGKLHRTRWVYDDEKDEGSYVTSDVTEYAPKYLFDVCTLDHDVILNDVFLLLQRHIDVYATIFDCWIEEIIREGLAPFEGKETTLKHVELYWCVEYYEQEREFSGNVLPGFHGIGLQDDIPYSLMFTPANEIAALPLKLNPQFIVSYREASKNLPATVYHGPEFSLGQILYGVLWELSWTGPPQERDKKRQELEQEKLRCLPSQDIAE